MTGTRSALQDLVALLDLESAAPGLYRGVSPSDRWQRVFGGQVLGQALVAATRTVEGRFCHSLHAYFLRPGNPKTPILYRVERSHDGNSFSSRRVTALQNEREIFIMDASFHIREESVAHQVTMPDVEPPEAFRSEREWRMDFADAIPPELKEYFLKERPIEIRPVSPLNRFAPGKHPAQQIVWIKANGVLPDTDPLHQCVLAYASDMNLLDTSLLPHGLNLFSPGLQLASLDHAMWFHRPFRADEWLLYVLDSPTLAGARGFNRGMIFRRDGTLVASAAQEGLVRRRTNAGT